MPEDNGEQNQNNQNGDGKPGEGNPKTFTQDQVNSILAEDRRKVEAKFSDYADLKDKAQKYDEGVEASKSEQEKAVTAARKEGEQTANERVNRRLIAAEARAVAASARFRNPSDAVKLADLSDVTIGDDGEVDADALKKALDFLAESSPYLIDASNGDATPRPKPDTSQGGGSGGKNPGDAGRMAAERRFGKRT